MYRREADSNLIRTEDVVRPGHARRYYITALSIILMLSALAGPAMLYAEGPAEAPAAGPVHTNREYWIGRNISEAEKEFGPPTFSEQLIETGGMLVIYAGKKNPVHFVFETDPGGRIIKAARVE